MTPSIRKLALGLAVCLFAVLAQLSWWQFFKSGELRNDQGNKRTLYEEYDRERGPILIDQDAIASSTPTDDALKYLREYSAGPQNVSATGFYSSIYGATGIERTANDVLSGRDSRLVVSRLETLLSGKETKGGAVALTLNPKAQRVAYEGLSKYRGAVAAIEPNTGAILALAQSPSFDPNKLSSHDAAAAKAYYEQLNADKNKPMLNRPLAATNPPGSTFKLVTVAAALESGRWQADSVVPGPATMPYPGSTKTLPNWTGTACGPDGKTTITNALIISCNTAMAYLGTELGEDALRQQAQKFGFDDSFEVPMTAATSRFPEGMDQAQLMMASIGQFDVRATALQMAMVTAAIGNGGDVMEPYLIKEIRAPDLSVLENAKPRRYGKAISSTTAAEITKMMVGVVTKGTGPNARIPGVNVGGKTGTAEQGGGVPTAAWFVALAPAEAPKVAVAVVIEESGSSETSGNTYAAPICRDVIKAVLGL